MSRRHSKETIQPKEKCMKQEVFKQ